jgi:hypothetical protein
MPVALQVFSHLLGDLGNVYDLPKKSQEDTLQFIRGTKRLQAFLDQLKPLIWAFCNLDMSVPNVAQKRRMRRNSVPLSDTDSVLFTTQAWAKWYTGGVAVTEDAARISTFIAYWLTLITAEILNRLARHQGCTDKYEAHVKMKNEYFFPVLLIFPVKKTYASRNTIQEGMRLPGMEFDVKGGLLRSSDVCRETRRFNEWLLKAHILSPAAQGDIDGWSIIREIIKHENRVRSAILAGDLTFLKRQSIKPADQYADAERSSYLYYEAWQQLFADQYGDMHLPGKFQVAQLLTPTPAFLAELQEKNPQFHAKFQGFFEKYKKWPSAIAINPTAGRIPPEIIPLVDTRGIIMHNSKTAHLIARTLNLGVGFESLDLLFSDVYLEVTPTPAA